MSSLANQFICPNGGISRLYPEWMGALTPIDGIDQNRRLLDTPDIEIEKPFIIDPRLRSHMEARLKKDYFSVEVSTANSLYFDSAEMDLLISHLLTLRDRPGGVASDGTLYHALFGLKYRHRSLQECIDKIVANYFPQMTGVWKFIPDARGEIERRREHPCEASELRFTDLPVDIQATLAMALGQEAAENFVFKPLANTVVVRHKYSLYLNAKQFVGDAQNPFGTLSFDQLDLRSKCTYEMKQAGNWICLEPGFDDIDNRRPKPGVIIANILNDPKTAKALMLRTAPTDCMEYEVKPEKSGHKLTDDDVVRAFVGFGLAVQRTDGKLKQQFETRAHGRRGKERYMSIRPAFSKAVRSIQTLYPRCKKGQGEVGASFQARRLGMP